MKKCAVGFVIFSLLLTLPMLSQYEGKSFSEIKITMNSTLKLLRDASRELAIPYAEARILKIVKNQSGKVDFYAQILIRREDDEHSFAMTLGVVMGVVTRCTRQVSWSSDKLYFCPANTDKPKYWISTSRADTICRMNISPLADTWDDKTLAKVILKALHQVKEVKFYEKN